MDASSSFSHFRLPLPSPHSHSHSHSQTYPAIAVSDSHIPLETGVPRCVLRGSLDPTTGIFYRAPEHTRIRTTQACDKCRVRKAKCSGDHPVCERCHIRGLICHYAPERRTRQWSKAKAVQDAVPDRSTGRPGVVPQSSGALDPGPPRSKSGDRSTLHGPSSCRVDAHRPRSGGNGNGQRNGSTTPRECPRRATIASAAVHSSLSSSPILDEGAVQPDASFLQQVLNLRRSGPDRSRTGHDHSFSGSHCAVPVVDVAGGALETAESMACRGGDGKETLEGYLDIQDALRIEENELAFYLDSYAGGPSSLLQSIPTTATNEDVSRVPPSDHNPTYIHPGLSDAEYPESLDGAQYPMLFHHSPPSHWSGPGPGSSFDMSSVDLGMMSNSERPSFCCVSDVESPGRTPSPSSSASPDLTRASSDGLPTTPTNSYPNSPFTFASLLPHFEPFVSDPNAYPHFTSEVQTMDMGTHHYRGGGGGGVLTEYVGWHEVKDRTHAFRENLGLIVDMDPVF